MKTPINLKALVGTRATGPVQQGPRLFVTGFYVIDEDGQEWLQHPNLAMGAFTYTIPSLGDGS